MKLYHAPGVVMMFTNANLIVKHAQPVEDHTMSAQMIAVAAKLISLVATCSASFPGLPPNNSSKPTPLRGAA